MDQPIMNRSVGQLLFSYLPERTIDWDEAKAIVVIDQPHFSDIWEYNKSQLVFEEVGRYFDRWCEREGKIDLKKFPDPRKNPNRYIIGTPDIVTARIFSTALFCRNCLHLVFSRNLFYKVSERGNNIIKCPNCKNYSLRQFPLAFIHGCGSIEPLSSYTPSIKSGTQNEFIKRPIKCSECQQNDRLFIKNFGERIGAIQIECRRCNIIVRDRLLASCPQCVSSDLNEADIETKFMRLTRHSASSAYYGHTITIMRLDKPLSISNTDSLAMEIRLILPEVDQPATRSKKDLLFQLIEQLNSLNTDSNEYKMVMEKINEVSKKEENETERVNVTSHQSLFNENTYDEMRKSVLESLSLRERVHRFDWKDIINVKESTTLVDTCNQLANNLGFCGIELLKDLPIVTSTFGYSRRSFDPVFKEQDKQLSTHLIPFPVLNLSSARKAGYANLASKIPILAREGSHEGIFIYLDPNCIIKWLKANGILLPNIENPRLSILSALEPVKRYYDDIWLLPIRRMVFGLIHTFSHVVMRAASLYSGLDRTSISEYVFLPLMGVAIYSNSMTGNFGAFETVIRDNLLNFLESIYSEGIECLYDPECSDQGGACVGCIHAPEVSCRYFNHGLSRSFLLGGPVPWLQIPNDDEKIIGFWEIRK